MTAGSSSGNTSQNIVINTAGNANVFHPVLFTPSSLSAGSAVSSDSTITLTNTKRCRAICQKRFCQKIC